VKHTVEMRNIVKRFPGVLANNRISLTIRVGEVHVLLGENGAGKSTLMQILYGFYAMDSGEILIDGQRVHLNSPRDAIALGIGMVHQEFMLVRSFSVVENTVVGSCGLSGLLDLKGASARIRELSHRYGLAVDPAAKIASLPIGVQQRVEILKALNREARLLILDEPTAVLTPHEKDQLFAALRNLREAGCSVVLVTHKLGEVLEIANRVTVLRDGQVVGHTLDVAATSKSELARRMVGRDVNLRTEKPDQVPGEPVLRVEKLRVRDDTGQEKVRGVTLEIRGGEILGVAGVDGNGQSELAQAIMHLRQSESGSILLKGVDVTPLNVAQRRAAGISYVPADRRQVGSVAQMSVADNAILGLHRKHRRGLFRSIRAARQSAQELVSRFDVRTATLDFAAGKLSGGNLQKLILGREMMRGAGALIVEHPTRGLDIAAVESVWQELLRARREGKAILLISAELEELMNLADRIAVMFDGRIVGTLDAASGSIEAIGSMMAGIMASGMAPARPINEAHGGQAL
jgi:general nucleoside transport system ATP-binding protein